MSLARRRRAGASDEAFFAADAPREFRDLGRGVGEVELPIRYHRSDCFMAVFSADLRAVGAMLPSDRLHPVRLSAGRGAVAVVAYNYLETGVGAYGEIGVAVLATFDRSAPVLLPALLEGRYPGFGAYVAHLPVTTRVARQAGRLVWGYPKFVADMDFHISPERQRVEMSEGGHDVLSLSVERGGRVTTDNNPTVTYTELSGDLIRTTLPMRTIYQASMGAKAGHLELGTHPVADELRQIEVSPNPVATKSFLVHNAILPIGEAIADAAPRNGFEGSTADTGRHTVRYDDRSMRMVTNSSSPGAKPEEPTQADASTLLTMPSH
jgi:hypothetical protein